MPLEVYKYINGKTEVVDYEVLQPGERRHVVSLGIDRQERLYEIYCQKNDKATRIDKSYPMVITNGVPPIAIVDDFHTERNKVTIKKGEEHDLYVRQRVSENGKTKIISGKLRLVQR
jgi:hypothetical protein